MTEEIICSYEYNPSFLTIQNIPFLVTSQYSKKYIIFIDDCGNIIATTARQNYSSNKEQYNVKNSIKKSENR